MKLSLSWIFDHLKSSSLKDYNVHELLSSVKGMPAEIDSVHTVAYDWSSFTCGVVIEQALDGITVESAEWRKKIKLPERADVRLSGIFLIKKSSEGMRWATIHDLGGNKEGLVPECYIPVNQRAGEWKQDCEAVDYILEIENKSITNRPDLWSHRGIAREFAALLGLEMVPEEHIVHVLPTCYYAQQTDAKAAYSLTIATDKCTRFAGIEISLATGNYHSAAACSPWMASRLARIDIRPRLLLADYTNYVMMDLGQPMHAFDAQKIDNKALKVRFAREKEKIALLDGTSVTLQETDLVVADGNRPLAVAGIKGGSESAITTQTKKIFLESANFDGVTIRHTATRHKIRTDSSLRFEKGIDPSGNTTAIMRYVKLLDDTGIHYKLSGPIMSLGALPEARIVVVDHQFILDRLGITISPERVEDILYRLGFGVQVSEEKKKITYILTVPTWRAGKDVTIKEDILEEIARCFGYDAIIPAIPVRPMLPHDDHAVQLKRTVKDYFAGALRMREVYNYILLDEAFLQKTGIIVNNAVSIKNPLSEHAQRLIVSVVPNLLKNIEQNCVNEDRLRFFEWGSIWRLDSDNAVFEQTVCAGVIYEKDGSVDFYKAKAEVQPLFDILGLLVEWRPVSVPPFPWVDPLRSVDLVCQGQVIGYSGMIKDSIVGSFAKGNVFVIAFFRDVIAKLPAREYHFVEPSKYQPVDLDLSMLVPYGITLAQLEEIVAHVDVRIRDITLMDVFEKPEWQDRRSITLRCRVQDDEKTLTKQEIDAVQSALHAAVKAHGVEVR